MRAIDDFAEFTRSETVVKEGQVPPIFIFNDDEREWLDLIRHFEFLPIAFSARDPSYYLAIDVFRRELTRTQDTEYLGKRYAEKSTIHLNSYAHMPLFAQLAEVVRQQYGIAAGDLRLRLYVPRPFMAYLNWRVLKECQARGVRPEQVRLCKGRLVRAGATWTWQTDALLLTQEGRG